ncbi:MAG: hypothetical protein HC888_19710 [Candidatus Competibacteraceae bacterium]|nr:hypothetical protein [Candidatus Competibacteraceae bacterium]
MTFLLSSALTTGLYATTDLLSDPYGPARARGEISVTGSTDNNIDSINLLNGGLNLSIPIGQSYPAGGALSYALHLHYNSHVEDIRSRHGVRPETPEEPATYAVHLPNAASNAGLGWSLHMGRLLDSTNLATYNQLPLETRDRQIEPAFIETGAGLRYIAPDGSVVDFFSSIRNEPPLLLIASACQMQTRLYLIRVTRSELMSP